VTSSPFTSQSSKVLKCRAVELLAVGVIPFEQWSHVFANPQLGQWEGLRAKAFAVWFSTMADFLKGERDWSALKTELDLRGERYEDVFERLAVLSAHYRSVLTLYSVEDQIFLRDRRLQNVHGRLHTFLRDAHAIPVFNPDSGAIEKVDKTAAEYRDIMARYYPRLRDVSKELVDRLVKSSQFARLTVYYEAKLRVATNLGPLIEALGVGAACGSE